MRRLSPLMAALWIASLAATLWLGSSLNPQPAPKIQLSRQEVPRAAGGEFVTATQIRAIVRSELASLHRAKQRHNPAPAEAAEASGPDTADPEPTPEVLDAVEGGSVAIEAGIADGVWDEADRMELQPHLAILGARDVDAVLAPLFAAINAQQVALQGPPL